MLQPSCVRTVRSYHLRDFGLMQLGNLKDGCFDMAPGIRLLQERYGATALYDACRRAVENALKGKHNRRAVLLVSDGIDNASMMVAKDFDKYLTKNKVPTYTIFVVDQQDDIRPQQEGNRVMNAIAAVSGGRAFSPEDPK